MNEQLRILLVEDNPSDALLISEGLADLADFDHDLVHVEQLADAVTRCRERPFDVVLLDLGLPGYTGIDTFREFHRRQPDVPVLVLTAFADRQVSLQALHDGAQDYVIKQDIQSGILGRAIQYAVERHHLNREVEQSRDRLRLLTARLHDTREQERVRISRELHDELGQKMSALKMDIRWIESRLGKQTESQGIAIQQRFAESLRLADDIIEAIQRIAFELRPSALDHLGIADAMREEARRFQARTGLRLSLALPDEVHIENAEIATTFFRIFQELLTNVARHAKATRVIVRLGYEKGELRMTVTDDGIGLWRGALESTWSLGLLGMQERVAAQNGTICFDTTEGGGTSVSVRIPVRNAKAV